MSAIATDQKVIDPWVAARLAEAPPLTDAQRAKLARLLGGGAR